MALVKLVHQDTGAVAQVDADKADVWRQYGYADQTPAKKPQPRRKTTKSGKAGS